MLRKLSVYNEPVNIDQILNRIGNHAVRKGQGNSVNIHTIVILGSNRIYTNTDGKVSVYLG
jgi:hypothetical protein